MGDHKAHCDYQQVAEDRRRFAATIGETIRAFVDELVAAGWSEHEARNANVHDLASRRGPGVPVSVASVGEGNAELSDCGARRRARPGDANSQPGDRAGTT